MKIYEWVDQKGHGAVTDWPRLQKAQRGKLESKLDMLVRAEVDPKTRIANLPPQLLAGPGYGGQPHIYKLKAKGNVQLRPMVCIDPHDASGWTVLYPSIERGSVLIPANAPDLAEERRQEIVKDRFRRRLLIDDED